MEDKDLTGALEEHYKSIAVDHDRWLSKKISDREYYNLAKSAGFSFDIESLCKLAAVLPESEQRKLVEQHIDVPRVLAHHFVQNGIAPRSELDDLISIGNLNLVNLARYYDPEKAPDFRLFALRMLKPHMLRYLRGPLREVSHGRSLDTPVSEGEDATLKDFLVDTIHKDPNLDQEELKQVLTEMMGVLTDREKKVIVMRFGLEDGEFHTLEEVAQQLGHTRASVLNWERQALAKLRAIAEDHGLRVFKSSLQAMISFTE